MFEGKKFQQVGPPKKKHRTGRATLGYRSGSVPPLQLSAQQATLGKDGYRSGGAGSKNQLASALNGGSPSPDASPKASQYKSKMQKQKESDKAFN